MAPRHAMGENPAMRTDARSRFSGFTMAEIAIVLMIIGVIAATYMMDMVTGSAVRAQEKTLDNMKTIEATLIAYYKVNNFIPCPAPGDVSLEDNDFGRPTGTAGNCLPNATAYTGPISGGALGTVPVKVLGLGDEVALDGWGRRISYIVDTAYTVFASPAPIAALQTTLSAGGATVARYPVVLVSYGKQGNGAFPTNGSLVANRIFTYENRGNANEQENIGIGTNAKIVVRPFAPITAVASDRFDQVVKPVSLK